MKSNGKVVCPYCHVDPFEYVSVGDAVLAVAVSCCEQAIKDYYQGLINLDSPGNDSAPQITNG